MQSCVSVRACIYLCAWLISHNCVHCVSCVTFLWFWKSISATCKDKIVGLNGSLVISTNLILRAKYERGLKIVPVATVTCVAGYGFLVDGNEQNAKTGKERLRAKSIAWKEKFIWRVENCLHLKCVYMYVCIESNVTMYMLPSWSGYAWKRDFKLNETFTWLITG